MSIIESIINGLIGAFMIWVIIILLLVVWVFFGTFIHLAVFLALIYYCCKNAYKLFGLLGATGRKLMVVVVAAFLFLAYYSQNIINMPLWFAATIIVTLAYHTKKNSP